jgi:hypothetical protein
LEQPPSVRKLASHTASPEQIALIPQLAARTPQELMRYRGRFSRMEDRNDVRALSQFEWFFYQIAGYPAGPNCFIHLG